MEKKQPTDLEIRESRRSSDAGAPLMVKTAHRLKINKYKILSPKHLTYWDGFRTRASVVPPLLSQPDGTILHVWIYSTDPGSWRNLRSHLLRNQRSSCVSQILTTPKTPLLSATRALQIPFAQTLSFRADTPPLPQVSPPTPHTCLPSLSHSPLPDEIMSTPVQLKTYSKEKHTHTHNSWPSPNYPACWTALSGSWRALWARQRWQWPDRSINGRALL